jgi:hypothetical protein
MDLTAAEGERHPLDVEVDRGDIQVVPVEVIALHSRLQVEEGDIPMAPHHHRIVSHHLVVPATAMIPRHIEPDQTPCVTENFDN